MLKKITCSLLALLFSILLILPPAQIVKASSPAPAVIKGVTYTLKPGVKMLPQNVSRFYNKVEKSLILDSMNNFNPSIGQIYIDPAQKTSFRIASMGKDKLGKTVINTEIPSMKEVLENFNIPRQSVMPTAGNVRTYKEGMSFSTRTAALPSPIASTNSSFLTAEVVPDSVHRFDMQEVTLINQGSEREGNYLQLKVNGYIEFQMPTITASGGITNFKLDLSAYEKSNITIDLKGKLKEDCDFLIAGYTLPFDIGEVDLGIYLHFNVNGEITVNINVGQEVNFNTGVTGDYDFPFSYNVGTYCNAYSDFTFTSKVQGNISATAGIAAKAGLKIWDTTLAGFRAEFGVKASAEVKGELTDCKVDVLVNAFLDIKAKIIGKDYKIYNKEWKIYESHDRYTAGYTIALTQADAYSNRIAGIMTKGEDDDGNPKPYTGTALITIKRGGTVLVENKPSISNPKGEFKYDYPDLRPGDIVIAKVDTDDKDGKTTDPTVETEGIKATVPFNKIEITIADALNDKVKGRVSGDYTGPIVITVQPPAKPGASSTARPQTPKPVIYKVNCVKGEFANKIPLTGYDKVTAGLNFEGYSLAAPQVTPTLGLKINFSTDKNGTKGTIQNVGGITPYTGKVSILCKSVPLAPAAKIGEVNPVPCPPTSRNAGSETPGTVNRRISGTQIPGSILQYSQYLDLVFNNSSQFEFKGLKAPESLSPSTPWSAYARIEYEGAVLEAVYTINLSNMLPNINGKPDPVLIDFDHEDFYNKSKVKLR